MSQETVLGKMETEIKVRLTDRNAFTSQLPALGFHLLTAETMERNVLFDTPDDQLRTARRITAHPPVWGPLDIDAQSPGGKFEAVRIRYG